MTNGEKIIEIFPNMEYEVKDNTVLTNIDNGVWFSLDWWNAEFKEPTTENNLPQERYQDLIDYFGDKEVAKTILEDKKEFKAWLERLRWNVKRADELARELERIKGTTKNDLPHCQYSDEEIAKSFIEDVEAVKDQLPCGEQMDFPSTFDEFAKDYGFKDKDEVYTNGSELIPVFRVKQWLEHISTTKNNLAVDCIDRQATLDAIIKRLGIKNETYLLEAERAIYQQILAMPSVTPQLSSELEKDFGELGCISRQAVLELIADDNLSMGQVVRGIHALPSVNLQEPRKGHWIYKKFDEKTGITNVHICSKCGCPLASPYKSFCSACGSDNREVEE